MLHREIAINLTRNGDSVGVENPDYIWVIYVGQQNSLAQHLLNFRRSKAGKLEQLQSLSAEIAMSDAVHLRKGSFAKESFNFIGVSDCLAVFKEWQSVSAVAKWI